MIATMTLATNLKKLRTKKGVSQKELADAIGVSFPRISELESGRANPTLSTIEAIANYFETSVAKLLSSPEKKVAKSA